MIDIDNQELSKFIDSILPDMYIKKEKNDYYDSQPQTFYYPLKQSKDDDDTQIYKHFLMKSNKRRKTKRKLILKSALQQEKSYQQIPQYLK